VFFEWHERFLDVREDVEDDERNGSPRSHRTDGNVKKRAESGALR